MAEESSNKKEKRFQWIAFVLVPIVCVVVGIIGTLLSTTYSNRMRTLQYDVFPNQSVLRKPTILDKPLVITLDGKKIDNISTMRINLYNNTDQDFENVPVDVTLKNEFGPVQVPIQVNTNLLKDAYTIETPDSPPSSSAATYRYNFHVLNRSSHPVAKIDFVFEGNELPEASVNVSKKGLEAEFTDTQKVNGFSWLRIVELISLVILFLVGWLTTVFKIIPWFVDRFHK